MGMMTTRRQFLRSVLAAAVILAVLPDLPAPAESPIQEEEDDDPLPG